jgi:hypothetical protein
MIKEHKVIGILINTVVTCGLTIALIQTNWDTTKNDDLSIAFIIGILGNAALSVSYVNNTREDE